ncbi:MFS transporter [Microbispora sp. GKU 823]|uniref:MFS transporter n=1 Tax=Microbispora sp. GKU 823 TaxID=1652100 RepID=UPI00117C2297|nr:MFS transporter [Microbispora sp. GKU 823]
MPAGVRLYLVTALLARLAEEGVAVAAVLLALDRSGSAAEGAFVLTALMAPHVFAAPLAGALAGRVRSPRVFYAGALAGFALAVEALVLLVGRAPLPVTLAVALAGGCCGPVVSGGLSGLLAVLVPAGAARDRAYALDAAVFNAASVTGPLAVTVVTGLASPAPAMAAVGTAAACAAVLVALLPHRRRQDTQERPTLWGDLMAGLAVVWRIRELRAITAATCLAFLGIGGLTAATVLFADAHGSPGAGGALVTAFAVGALIGSLAVARRPVPAPRLAGLAMLGLGLALAVAALAPSVTWAVLLFALAGLFDGPLLSATLRIRADHAPPRLRPQVFTLGAGLKITAASCGSAVAGLCAGLPAPLVLLGIAAVQVAAAVLYAIVRSPRTRGTTAVPEAFTP